MPDNCLVSLFKMSTLIYTSTESSFQKTVCVEGLTPLTRLKSVSQTMFPTPNPETPEIKYSSCASP